MVFNKKNMQKILITFFLFGLGGIAHGQDATGTMLQQIGALQTYIRIAEQGYQATEKGLETIRAIRKGEFDLHTGFFHSLSVVNPAVKNMLAAAWLLRWQEDLEEVNLLLTDGALTMTDGERIRRIMAIEASVKARNGY
jgi:hypothetical protein